MSDDVYTVLEGRGVLEIAGDDRREFLQGLISNDTRKLGTDPRALRGVPDAAGEISARLLPGGGRRDAAAGRRAGAACRPEAPALDLQAPRQGDDIRCNGAVPRRGGIRRRARQRGWAFPPKRAPPCPSPTASPMWTRAFRTSAHGCCCRGPRARQRSMPRVSPAQTAPPTTGCACHWAFPTAAAISRWRRRSCWRRDSTSSMASTGRRAATSARS